MEKERAEGLYAHVRAVEQFDSEIKDIQEDKKIRLELAKAEDFDTDVIKYVVKRRKNNHAVNLTFDDLVTEYEEVLEEQKQLKFTGTRVKQPATAE